MSVSTQQTDNDFENEVRRIARAKWPSAQYAGAQMLDGRERDGIFETEESIHFIEATVSGSASKAREDTKKLFRAVSDHNKTGSLKVAIGWFVTRNEPTADQRKEVSDHGKGQVRALSYTQFQQSLINVRAYLDAREQHFFGSVQDFSSDAKRPSVPFVTIGLSEPSSGKSFSVADILNDLLRGKRFVITGQYGAGKSMSLRETYFLLKNKYINNQARQFPVYINLREHSGQRDPIEILERHARGIGFDSPASLIRAWRAGFVVLLIDGFDEVTSLGVQGTWKKLKDLRMRSLEGIRRLIRESGELGIAIAGRSHYFETDSELAAALGLRDVTILRMDEFSETQINVFLSQFPGSGNNKSLPAWVPTRPLLLGYLASRGLLADITDAKQMPDAVDGWDYLLERIYQREERIDLNLDGATLRRILERLSSIARTSEDQLGPIRRTELFSAFQEVCGYEPDEQGILAIQRLPGLGMYRAEDESRCFIDRELVAVCSGRELLNFIQSPYDMIKNPLWVDCMNTCDTAINQVSAELCCRLLRKIDGLKLTQQAAAFLNSRSDLACARGDIAAAVLNGNLPFDVGFEIKEIAFLDHPLEFDADTYKYDSLSFSHCLFRDLYIQPGVPSNNLPLFNNCIFEKISGRVSIDDLPKDKFLSCEFSKFDNCGSSVAIRSGLSNTPEKVLLITLRKLYVQSLSGRAESALYRGLDFEERRFVDDILKLLYRHGLATDYSKGDGVIWLPMRKELDRVRRILAAPSECGEAVVTEARNLH